MLNIIGIQSIKRTRRNETQLVIRCFFTNNLSNGSFNKTLIEIHMSIHFRVRRYLNSRVQKQAPENFKCFTMRLVLMILASTKALNLQVNDISKRERICNRFWEILTRLNNTISESFNTGILL